MELKQRMTFEEMTKHMKDNSFKLPSKVTVGKYAKTLGYSVYKPMVDGKVLFYYINEDISK